MMRASLSGFCIQKSKVRSEYGSSDDSHMGRYLQGRVSGDDYIDGEMIDSARARSCRYRLWPQLAHKTSTKG
jgi:hypothetical protein